MPTVMTPADFLEAPPSSSVLLFRFSFVLSLCFSCWNLQWRLFIVVFSFSLYVDKFQCVKLEADQANQENFEEIVHVGLKNLRHFIYFCQIKHYPRVTSNDS